MSLKSERYLAGLLILALSLAAAPAHARRFGGGRSFGSHSAPHSSASLAREGRAPTHESAAMGGSEGISIRPRVYVGGDSATAADDEEQRLQAAGMPQPSTSRRSSMLSGWWLSLAVPVTLIALRYRKYKSRGNREQEFAAMMLAEHAREPARRPGVNAAAGMPLPQPAVAAVNTGLADGSDAAGLLRQARASFLHLRSLNQALHGEQVRNYLTAALAERLLPTLPKNAEQVKFPSLKCDLLDSSAVAGGCRARLRFSGSMRLTATGPAFEFAEIWHMRKASAIDAWLAEDIVRDDPPA